MANSAAITPCEPTVSRVEYPQDVVEEATRTFVPLNGNPENGDYLDWYRHLEEVSAKRKQERT